MAATLASYSGKGNMPKSKERDCSLIVVDPIESVESSGTRKKYKGEDGEDKVIPILKENLKDEAVNAGRHRRPEELGFYAGIIGGLGIPDQLGI